MSRFFCKFICATALSMGLAAHAEKIPSDFNAFMAEQMTKKLSIGLRYKDVFGSYKAQGPKDQEILKMLLQTRGEEKMPIPKLEGRKMIFSGDGKPLQIELVDYLMGKIRVNNQEVDFRSRTTLADQLSYIERVLAHQSSHRWSSSPIVMLLQSEPAHANGIKALVTLAMNNWVAKWDVDAPGMSPEQIKVDRTVQYIEDQYVIEKGMKDIRIDLSRCDTKQGAIWSEGNNLLFSWDEHSANKLSDMMRECCGKKMRKLCESEINRVFPASGAKPIPFQEWQSTK